jgi:hypothetical protein
MQGLTSAGCPLPNCREDVPAVFGSAYRIVLSYLLRHPGITPGHTAACNCAWSNSLPVLLHC